MWERNLKSDLRFKEMSERIGYDTAKVNERIERAKKYLTELNEQL